MFSYVSLEQRVPQDHPLRAVRKLTDTVLRTLSAEFDALYADSGRPSIAPEYILRAQLLQVFWSSKSTTTFCSAGLWVWAWTMRCGTTRCFRRTETGC
jgi:transposase